MARWSARVAGGWDARLVFEPGRLIVGNAGILLIARDPGEAGHRPIRS